MAELILRRAIDLYWAFMPEAQIIDHATLTSWQWKLCWDLACHIEQEHLDANVRRIGHG